MSPRGRARLWLYLLAGPLIAYVAAVIGLVVALLLQGQWGSNAPLVVILLVFAVPATPLGWGVGIGLFAPVLLLVALGSRVVPPVALMLAAAAGGALIYWLLVNWAIGAPRVFDSAELNDMIRWVAPLGGGVGGLLCEWMTQRVGSAAVRQNDYV